MSKQATDAALLHLQKRIKIGVTQQAALLQRVDTMIIRDKLPPPTCMEFSPQYDDLGGLTLTIRRTPGGAVVEEDLRLHHHALGQLVAKVHMWMPDVSDLLTKGGTPETIWMRELLAHNFNERFHRTRFLERGGRPAAFLCRIVGGQLRGFLSRSFNRHLASRPLLLAFVEACRQAGAEPVEAVVSDVRLSLKCFRPLVFEPVAGEFVAVGVEWANSDFGSGKHTLRLTVWRVLGGAAVCLSEAISQVHIGSIIEESDVEISEETAAKEVEAQVSAIRDGVLQMLGDESITRLLTAIEVAQKEEISWASLKGRLKEFLYKTELVTVEALLENTMTIDLPPVGRTEDGKPVPTRWWAASIVAQLASKLEDEDRKVDLQRQAGGLIEGSFKEPGDRRKKKKKVDA